MSLPKLNEGIDFKKIKLINGKEVGIKPWRVREEKELMFATDGIKDKNLITKEILKLINKCTDNFTDVSALSESAISQISIELRKISKGETVEFGYTCAKCKAANTGSVDLNKDIVLKKFDDSPIKIENLSFKLKEIPYETLIALREKYTKTTELNYHILVNSLDCISTESESYANFTIEEAYEFIDDLKVDIFNELMGEMISKMSAFVILKKSKCISCKTESSILFDNVTDFFGY